MQYLLDIKTILLDTRTVFRQLSYANAANMKLQLVFIKNWKIQLQNTWGIEQSSPEYWRLKHFPCLPEEQRIVGGDFRLSKTYVLMTFLFEKKKKRR